MATHLSSLAVALGASALLSGCAVGASGRVTSPATGTASASVREWAWDLDPSVADSISIEVLAPSVRLYRLANTSVPWRAVVLDLDLAGCVSLRALKGSATAVGRRTTSALLSTIPYSDGPVAAVNADFFLFAPAGVLTGAHVEQGAVFTGPGDRPVFAIDSGGRPFIGVLQARGTASSARGSWSITGWNRPGSRGLAVTDARWGQPLDSSAASPRWRLIPLAGTVPRRYLTAPATEGMMASGDTLLLSGTDPSANAPMIAGDTISLSLELGPVGPREAVGGFPLLLADSAPPAGPVSQGSESFRGPNPRTAVGIAAGGRRVLLVVIDGRQPGVSAGTTIDQTAAVMRSLGAVEALNLDGGGSSAMVLAGRVGRREAEAGSAAGPRIVNRPSDGTGERAVGNALAVLSACDSR